MNRLDVLDFTALRNIKNDLKVMVYGDQLLDRNVLGENIGWSRENQNIHIFIGTEERYNPGGGGNLACNVARLASKVVVCGLWGDPNDMYRLKLQDLFDEQEIDCYGMLDAERTGVFGKMYLKSGIHIGRSDIALPRMNAELIKPMMDKATKILDLDSEISCILTADYDEFGQGICRSEILEIFTKNENTLTFGTSRSRIVRMKDFDFLFLNEKELIEQLTGSPARRDVLASALLSITKAKCLVLTLANEGVRVYFTEDVFGLPDIELDFQSLFDSGPSLAVVSIPTIPLRDVDPCGCGDTFLSTFSTAIMANYNVLEAASIGNAAARVVAQKRFGAASASVDEIEKEYAEIQRQSR